VALAIDAAREEIFVHGPTTPLQPGNQSGAHVCGNFELNRSVGLLLDNSRSVADVSPSYDVADPDLDQVTASQFTVDSEIEEGLVPQPPFAVEMEADRPNLLLCEGALSAHILAGIPSRTCLLRIPTIARMYSDLMPRSVPF